MRAGSRALGPVEGFCGGLLAQGSETRPNVIALTPSFSRLSLAPWEAAPKGCSAPAGFRSTEVWARSAMASCGPLPPGGRAGRTAEGEGLLLPPASASGLASSLSGLSAWGTRGPSWSFPSPAASLYCPQPGPQGAKGEVGPASSVGAAFSSLLSQEQKSSPSKAAARSFPEVRSHPEGAWPPVRP